MQPHVRLVLCLHNHQPVGNFDGVFEAAYQESYLPFLDLFENYPKLPIALHTSGSLLEWLQRHHPEYLERVKQFVQRGQIEIIGGPFYEPILAAIPRRDRIGQIQAYTRHLESLFETNVRGMWMPERVWEQCFAGDVTQAGIEYTIVDDFHFRGAGVPDQELHGYYLTEDEGRLLKIFPGSERLRYTIPFANPPETIDYLRDIAERFPGSVVAFGDDGEKFGTWPETHKHVYEDGWLKWFFDTLMEHRDWLTVCTFATAVDQVPPQGRIYLPDASYREMSEWALPTEQQKLYHELVQRCSHEFSDWDRLKQFVRGGFWRNFLAKYPESNEMYCRMREVSDRIENLTDSNAAQEHPHLFELARTELYRAQCNCPYWHGAFGGLYLPHLRNAIYSHLIAADTAAEQLAGQQGSWVSIQAADYNLDARKEVKLASDRLAAYLAPARGGHLYELDIRSTRVNLLATLNRRPEAYHEKVRQAAHQEQHGGEHAVSIHDLVKWKQPDLDQKLHYDHWPRKSLVDHVLSEDSTLESLWKGHADSGDFVQGVYETKLRKSPNRVEAILRRSGKAGDSPLTITKTIALDTEAGSLIEILYQLSGMEPNARLRFAVEFNFAAMPGGAEDRYFYDHQGQQLGPLDSILDLEPSPRIGLLDEWLGIDASLDFSRSAALWTFPIQTVSNSEAGFELVHQCCSVIPHWEVAADENGEWSVSIQYTIDTSIAQARQLAECAES